MKKIIFSLLVLAILISLTAPAFAMSCKFTQSGNSDECWTEVKVASAETTLVSQGTVLVYDVTNNRIAANTYDDAAYIVRVASASSDGVFVAGVAQRKIASGEQALIQVRGEAVVAVKTTDTMASGAPVFCSSSGDVTPVTSTTQTQLGFALENNTVSGNARGTKRVYLQIV